MAAVTDAVTTLEGPKSKPQSLSEFLVETARSFPGETVTVGEILAKIGERGLLVMSIVLCVPFLVPVSVPGVSTVFGLMVTLAGVAVTLRRPLWLPGRVQRRTVPVAKLRSAFEAGAKKVARLQVLVRPRIAFLSTPLFLRINGLVLTLAGLLLMAPFGLIPFSNTLPALAAVFIALGLLDRDGVFVLLGYAMTVGTIAYFGFLIGGAIMAGGAGLDSLMK